MANLGTTRQARVRIGDPGSPRLDGTGGHHALTFDVEDWQEMLENRFFPGEHTPSLRLDRQIGEILDFCDKHQVRATFFVVGSVARHRPAIVKEIAGRGHEIACHSNKHRLIFSMTRGEFLEDTLVAKQRLEEVIGAPVMGYRAPEFSVSSLDHWCFDVLTEAGFQYDSSVVPVTGPRYAVRSAPHSPFFVREALLEFPLLSARIGNVRLPVAGGSYYRLIPDPLLKWAVIRGSQECGTAVFYFHPYEFETGGLWLRGAGLGNFRATRYVLMYNFRTGAIRRRLNSLAASYTFAPLSSLCEGAAARIVERKHES